MAEYAQDVLVTTEWLAEHLDDPPIVVAEVDENPGLYDDGHIPGALKLDWRDDLQDPVERDLVDKESFEELMSRLGVSDASTVVLYGDKNNWFAAYAYWYLKIYRHEDVRILDGGRQKWLDEGRELRQGGNRLLPHRRAQRPHLVRSPRAAGLRAGQELRRLVDGVGEPRGRADREVRRRLRRRP